MNSNIDKVNMSLDDIIKLEKKQKKFQQKPGSPPAKGRGQWQQRGSPAGKQKKPFGLLNKSKAIQKTPNKPPRARGPANKKAIAAAASSLKSRLGPAPQLAGGKMQNLARIRRRRGGNNAANPPPNKAFNRYGSGNVRKPAAPAPKFQNAPQPAAPKPAQVPALNKAKADLAKAKIAMQTARKNVQKAKRLLATRKGPLQQPATQRFAKNAAAKRPRQKTAAVAKKAKLINAQPRNALIKVSVPNNRKPAQAQSRPVIKRSRPAQAKQAAGKGSNRMVFY